MRHLVGKQVFDIRIGASGDAFGLSNKLSSLYWRSIVPLLESLFDQYANESELIRIDRLEVDLGNLSEEQLADGRFLDKLRHLLEQELAKLVQAGGPKAEKMPVARGHFEQWLFFLEKGYLPWSASQPSEDWLKDVLEALATSVSSVEQLRGLMNRSRAAAERLVLQHDPGFLKTIVELYTGKKQDLLLQGAAELRSLMRHKNWPKPAARLVAWSPRQMELFYWQKISEDAINTELKLAPEALIARFFQAHYASGTLERFSLSIDHKKFPAIAGSLGLFVKALATGPEKAVKEDTEDNLGNASLHSSEARPEGHTPEAGPQREAEDTRLPAKADRTSPGEDQNAPGRETGRGDAPSRDSTAEKKAPNEEQQKEAGPLPSSSEEDRKVDGHLPEQQPEDAKELGAQSKGREAEDGLPKPVSPKVDAEELRLAEESRRRGEQEARHTAWKEKKTESKEPGRDYAEKEDANLDAASENKEKTSDEPGAVSKAGARETDGQGETGRGTEEPTDEKNTLPTVEKNRASEGQPPGAFTEGGPQSADVPPPVPMPVEKETGGENERAGQQKKMAFTIEDVEPEKIKPEELPSYLRKDKAPPYHSMPTDKELYVNNAGAVLLNPFLARYFENLGLLKKRKFIDEKARHRAVRLLHYLATGQSSIPEYELVLPKVLCGLPLDSPVDRKLRLSKKQKTEGDGMLEALIEHWGALGSTSPDGLREGFLQREGKLTFSNGAWNLKVSEQTLDILLDRLPWGIGIIKLPWMMDMLKVEWR